MTLTLDKLSRLVVPKPLRDRFGLQPGDELEVTFDGNGIHLRPVLQTSPLTDEEGIMVCSSEIPASVWDTATVIEQQRKGRNRHLGGM